MINRTDRIGLVGKNGAGKTTLLKIIAGQNQPDQGVIAVPQECTVGYLPQQLVFMDDCTVIDEARKAFVEIRQAEARLNALNHELSIRTDYESKQYLNILKEINDEAELLNVLGSQSSDAKIETTLFGLGFERTDLQRPTTEFSGGWRMRIELAKLLLRRPDVLLLDEPTNHLDIESIQWLEEFLTTYPGAVVLVSHDRAFLDNVTNRTIEISLGKIYDYKVAYSKYVELRKERREQQMAAFRNQQKLIGDTEDFIERFRYKATKAVQVQSRIKQLEKIDRIEVDEEDFSSIHFRFPAAERSGTVVVEAKGIVKKYGEHTVLNQVDLVVERGEKVCFVGRNGEGKTTFSKIIVNQLAFEGHLKLGHNVKLGYYAQNQSDLLDENKTVFQIIDDVAVGEVRTKIRDILGSFLFSGDTVDKKVQVLSGGERARLCLARLLLQPANLLVLDEPTNHLDMRSKDILKQALKQFDGTLILVSHDRDFLDGLTNKVYEFKNKNIKENIGGIYEFLRKKRIASLADLERKERISKEKETDVTAPGKSQYEAKKEAEKEIRKISSAIKKCEDQISSIEMQIAEMDAVMADPAQVAKATNRGFYETYNGLKESLEKEMQQWELLHSDLEQKQQGS